MNIEFHHHAMFLISVLAGYKHLEAEIIAHASQLVDDNTRQYAIEGCLTPYKNYISQTADIAKPQQELMRIYPLFHFQPGEPLETSAARKDGKYHLLNCTPDSQNARRIFPRAVETDNLYMIGIACHAYADTWAHANFTGYYDDFNAMKGVLQSAMPNIGHADALHNPDMLNHYWNDQRLTRPARSNNHIFMQAAIAIFNGLYRAPESERQHREHILKMELAAIFVADTEEKRLDYFRAVYASLHRYHRDIVPELLPFPAYKIDSWFNEAVKTSLRWFRRVYEWRDGIGYHENHWYKFQEAIKAYQNLAWEILEEPVFSKLQLENL